MFILIAILIYSLVLTCALIYKDNSGYFMTYDIDVVLAGPVMWMIILILYIFSPVLRYIHMKKKKSYKPKSSKQIEKIISRIINIHKNSQYYDSDDIFNLSFYRCDDYGIYGWKDLEIKDWKHEWINKKFESVMLHQEKDALPILMKYFTLLTEEETKNNWKFNYKEIYGRLK